MYVCVWPTCSLKRGSTVPVMRLRRLYPTNPVQIAPWVSVSVYVCTYVQVCQYVRVRV